MAILEKVMQMKQMRISDVGIIQELRQEGFSPREINEALSQANIKSAVNKEDLYSNQEYMQNPPINETSEMQPSIMQKPQPQEPQYTKPIQSEQYAQPQYPETDYYQEYQSVPQLDMETMGEMAEQIVKEKTEEIKKQIFSLAKFKKELEIEIQRIEQRLSKIENLFNELQMAILNKVGDYGIDIKNLADEMHQTQKSFSKILNPIADNIHELQKITKIKDSKKTKGGKKSQNFEDYLR